MDGKSEAQGLNLKAQGLRPKAEEALSDSELDREIVSAVGIDPSPEFLARVRTRIAAEPEQSPWRPDVVSAFRRTSVAPLAVVALVGIVLAVVVPRFIREEMTRPSGDRVARGGVEAPVVETPVETDSSTSAQGYGGPAVAFGADGQVGAPVTAGAVARRVAPEAQINEPHTLPLQLSPVMFAEEDRIAFASFVSAVADGTVPEKVVQALSEEIMTPLAIAPLAVDPLPPLARVTRQGEGQW